MNWSRGALAGTAPISTVVAVLLVIAAIWQLGAGHRETSVALLAVGAITGVQGGIGYWPRHRHPDPRTASFTELVKGLAFAVRGTHEGISSGRGQQVSSRPVSGSVCRRGDSLPQST